MADRFPLIVNAVSLKIEELVSGDRLDLSGNGIVLNGDDGTGKYLRSDGNIVHWDSPGDVYLNQTQTLTNKTLETCVISGSLNTLTNIPNSALVNAGITVNGTTIPLGGSVVTPDNNTTYAISAQDGTSASQKIVRLTSGGNAGAGVNDDVIIAVGSPSSIPAGSNALSLFLDRVDDTITLTGHVVDNNTITTLIAPGGAATSGAISFTSTGAATVSMTGSTINIDAIDTDTKTKIRVGTGGTYGPADNTTGNFTFLGAGAATLTQGVNGGTGDPEITVSSTDTVTRVRGGSTGTYLPSLSSGTSTTDISIEGGNALGGNVQVTQTGNTILIDSTDTNTITKIGSDNNGSPISPQPGNFRFKQAGDTQVTQTTNQSTGEVEITISSINTDTGATFNARGGVQKNGIWFQLKNYNSFSGNTLLKWDSGNAQLADSIITDDGSAVTIDGDLIVLGNQTILNTSVLQVEDNLIELRKGNNIVGFNGGLQLNRTTDSNGNVTSSTALQWYESGAYWRVWDGSVEHRLVTTDETQILTNKTLVSPILSGPTLGSATATSINGLEITSTASATLEVASSKSLSVSRSLILTSDNNNNPVNVNFRLGGDVAYKSDTLASFASTTATQLRSLITGVTGTDNLVFQTSPVLLTSIITTSSGFSLLNSGAQSIQFGGAATQIDIGAAGGTTTFDQSVVINEDLTVGGTSADNFICNAVFDSRNADILIRGGSTDPMVVGRGNGAVNTNTALGTSVLGGNSGGSQNTGVGYQSLLTNTSGFANTAVGYQTLRANNGEGNTAVGRASLLGNLAGDKNTAVGANTLEQATAGDANVCIGYYAGNDCGGSGNVLIGPADSSNPINDATYRPPNQAGNRQLVIGSGTEYWIRGDANFNLTLNNSTTVNQDLIVKGDLTVNGTTTTVNSNIVEISDKAINLASVVSVQFSASVSNGSANITAISPTLGLIPGMEVVSNTVGITIPSSTTIVSISGNTAVLSNNVTGTGTAVFSAIGPSDTAADGGGIIVNGTTNKNFLWENDTDAWTSSEHMDLASGKEYRINNVLIASSTQIGPSSGTFGLGAGVLTSALTSVGTLTSLTVSGNVNLTGTGYLQLPAGTTLEQPGQTGNPAAAAGMLRYNTSTSVFEGYDGNVWGKIGGGAAVQAAAPTNANEGDLWYDEDDGRLFVYYDDGTSAQWVDASPNGVPTDLVVEGTLSVSGTTNLVGDLSVGSETTNSNAGTQTLSVGSLAAGQSGGIQIWANPTNGNSFIQFGDGTASADQYRGYINYTHSNDRLAFGTAGGNRFLIDNSGNIEPGADATQDFGSASFRWANIYSADLQLSNEGSANEVDGTWGQYTIQEGEEDLFLINRRSGKKYKFMLQEVN